MAGMFSRISVFVFCFSFLAFFVTYSTSYANVTCTVEVDEVHMTVPVDTSANSGVKVVLKNTTGSTIPTTTWTNGTTRVFWIKKELGNQGLAIFLTALSNKTKVTATIAGTAVVNSLIQSIGGTQVAQ